MNYLLVFLFKASFIIYISSLSAASNNNNSPTQTDCLTVYKTTTITDISYYPRTFFYTSTKTIPANAVQTVTNYPDGQGDYVTEFELQTQIGLTYTETVISTTTIYPSATITKTSYQTVTTYPYATTTKYTTDEIFVFKTGTLTYTYIPPPIIVDSLNRYTGAPTSLWLSVI